MALQMSYTTESGTNFSECYIIVSNIIIMPETSMICTNYFANQSSFESGELPIAQPAYNVATNSFDIGPVFDAAYNYLLTLPEYSTATLS